MKSYTIKYDKTQLISLPDSSPYLLSEKLGKAVEVAITLGMPLLLTGEPGTGKTKLAEKIAQDLHQVDPNFLSKPLVFNAKTTSTAKDLFYSYDALKHFRDANIKKESKGKEESLHVANYIQLQALGKAIALTNEKEVKGRFLTGPYDQTFSSVVLIDEIDKAPRDFPNDILSEIEKYNFRIKEANNHEIKKGSEHQIILIMTSNSEKNLPEAFLRRTVFFHIDFPDKAHLIGIVNSHLSNAGKLTQKEQKVRKESLSQLVDLFERIRNTVRKKKPATAELIAWVRILEMQGLLNGKLTLKDFEREDDISKVLKRSYSILAKTKTDLKALEELELE